MIPGRKPTLALTLVGVMLLVSSRAEADPCTRVRVSTDGPLGAPWRRAIASFEAEIAALPETECAPIDLLIRQNASGARIDATAADGRRTDRDVATPSALSAIGMGLVASIPVEPTSPPPPSSSPLKPERADEIDVHELPPPDVAAPPPPDAPKPPYTASASIGGRVGMPTAVIMPELELRGDLRIDGWILAISGRGAVGGVRPVSRAIVDYAYEELSAGLAGGRRLSLGHAGLLDVTLGPRIGVISEEGDVPNEGPGGTKTDLWVEAAVRYVVPSSGRWRPSALVELDANPRGLAEASRVDPALPALPSWSIAVHVGVAGDVP